MRGYAKIGGLDIGREAIRSVGNGRAMLMKNHGVFSISESPLAALKSAVMIRDVARTMLDAFQLGEPEVIPPDEVERAHRRFLEEYGQ